jgi:hypothetical protein
MRRGFRDLCLMMVTVVVIGNMFLAAGCLAQPQHQPSSKQQEDSLKRFLRNYVGSGDDEKRTSYSSAFVDLKDDGTQEVIVFLSGGGWCGTGGCRTLILAPKAPSYRVVTAIIIAWTPIRVLTTKSHGWHDLSVWVEGGGIQPGYETTLSFDGRTYPRKTSVPPARRPAKKAAGKVVIPRDADETPLF